MIDRIATTAVETVGNADRHRSGFQGKNEPGRESAVATRSEFSAEMPVSPQHLRATGLTLMQVADLVLKQLYLQGQMLGVDIARQIRLPSQIVDDALRFLKEQRHLEVTSGDYIGTASYRFHLSEAGRRRARETFEQCGYVGPAPVPLDQYTRQCRRQAVSLVECTIDNIERAFADLVISQEMIQQIGPAVCSGKSIFLHGPPGSGKTVLAERLGQFLFHEGGDIFVPYAIQADSSIITVFDPTIHQAVDDDDVSITSGRLASAPSEPPGGQLSAAAPDARWRRIRRPIVVTGGELTLDMLNLQYHRSANFYNAPLHIKANGGVFLIDDFGRQQAKPAELLNRWILPLECRVDYLTLATGRKFEVPFEQLTVFSTNLDPAELVDDAFLRRIRHKIGMPNPDREMFTAIFRRACLQRSVDYNPEVIDYLYSHYYDQGRCARSSDPRDLLEIVRSICRFRKQAFVLSTELIAEAATGSFGSISPAQDNGSAVQVM